ncbi:MAG TPA: hypothetical protein VJR87_11985 [Allosphingosinicella sp.]|nr:hypothetical protein [Allosphingosinicella sp.]
MKQLDWRRLLGFEQITDQRQSFQARRSGKLGGKIGGKPGLKSRRSPAHD